MGLQISIPFTLSETGTVLVETDATIQTQQRIRALVGTEPGQRAMRADMGIPLSRLLFGVSETLIDAELRQRVEQQLSTYEPGTEIVAINPVTDSANDGIAELEIDFAPVLQASPDRIAVDSAVIKVGGTVKEVPINGSR
jgi:phage baseplate assembly protein W